MRAERIRSDAIPERPIRGEAEGESDPTPGDSDAGSVLALRDRLMGALTTLGEELRRLQASADIDLFDPVPYEVLLGIASRQIRLFGLLVRDPLLWTYDAAPHVLRPIAEGRITASWLLQQNDSRLYTKFKSHGMGKGKLLKLQLEDMVKEAPPDDDVQLYLESLDREVKRRDLGRVPGDRPRRLLRGRVPLSDGVRQWPRRPVQDDVSSSLRGDPR